ncbi:16S rRNA (cytidine(1402)-2'-O)-methyltransferase [Parahalioglobus pacificus]|uniref:Ribosomal RNA small subunit methyltransferase I n=1 Tax=Parahalioglobus pacificus TaxID=930806 RepID=A0A918XCW0_9GAMM|nr:16S rRNA (cytidine(1402)-2'-O)-methyltransferase [Halioglobus pacificus]GHD25926.1 ribosomal RNA small subunit methyltransferase I [Halioglobus pacificus]
MESGLYIVATPIGNLGDISARALDVLGAASLVAAEDTRHSQRLLNHFAIETSLIPYHEHSGAQNAQLILREVSEGGVVALISDAGTPLISDPGYKLVRDAQDLGLAVVPVPGACAAVAALSVAGQPTDRFLFCGFLPAKEGARAQAISALQHESATLVFYEAPHRVLATLESLSVCLGGEREATLVREISKAFETVRRASLAELSEFARADANQQRGEIVLVVQGYQGEEAVSPELLQLLESMAEYMPGKRAAALLAQYSGQRKNQLYQHLLDQKDD